MGKPLLCPIRDNIAAGGLKREDLGVNEGLIIREIVDVLNREYMDLGVLDKVPIFALQKKHVWGVAYEVSISNVKWWHFQQELMTAPPKTLCAFYDEGIQFPTAIEYLIIVSIENGPTSFYTELFQRFDLNPLQKVISGIVRAVCSDSGSHLWQYFKKSYHQPLNSVRSREHYLRLTEELRFN